MKAYLTSIEVLYKKIIEEKKRVDNELPTLFFYLRLTFFEMFQPSI